VKRALVAVIVIAACACTNTGPDLAACALWGLAQLAV